MQALTPTPRRACPITDRPGRRARASSTARTRARCARSYCGMPGRARQTWTTSGSRRSPAARRRSPSTWPAIVGVVGVDQRRIERPAAERAQEHAARGRAAREDRRVVLAAEEGEPFAARDDEPVGVEVHPQRAGVGGAEAEADDGDRRVRDGAQRFGGRRRVRREQRGGGGGGRAEDDALGLERRAATVERDRPAAPGAAVDPRARATRRRAPSAAASARGSSPSPSGNVTGRPSRLVPRVRNMPRRTLPCSRSSAARRGQAPRAPTARRRRRRRRR